MGLEFKRLLETHRRGRVAEDALQAAIYALIDNNPMMS